MEKGYKETVRRKLEIWDDQSMRVCDLGGCQEKLGQWGCWWLISSSQYILLLRYECEKLMIWWLGVNDVMLSFPDWYELLGYDKSFDSFYRRIARVLEHSSSVPNSHRVPVSLRVFKSVASCLKCMGEGKFTVQIHLHALHAILYILKTLFLLLILQKAA